MQLELLVAIHPSMRLVIVVLSYCSLRNAIVRFEFFIEPSIRTDRTPFRISPCHASGCHTFKQLLSWLFSFSERDTYLRFGATTPARKLSLCKSSLWIPRKKRSK